MPPTIDTTAMRKVTPIMTPSRVKKLLSFCTQICCRARRTASKNGIARLRDPELLHERRTTVVARHETVAQHDDSARVRGDVRLVRHHDHRLSLIGEALEHPHDLLGSGRVEISGR